MSGPLHNCSDAHVESPQLDMLFFTKKSLMYLSNNCVHHYWTERSLHFGAVRQFWQFSSVFQTGFIACSFAASVYLLQQQDCSIDNCHHSSGVVACPGKLT